MRHHLQRFFRGNGEYKAPNPLGSFTSTPETILLDGMSILSVDGTLGDVFAGAVGQIDIDGMSVLAAAGVFNATQFTSDAAQIDIDGMSIASLPGVGNDPELVPDSEMNNISLWTVANSGTGIAYAYAFGGTMTVVGDVGAILTITNNGSVVTGLDYDYELKINSSTFTGLGAAIYVGGEGIWPAALGAGTYSGTITNLTAGASTAGRIQVIGAGTLVIDYLRIQRTVANTDFFFMDPEQVDIDGMSVLSADGAFVTASLLIFEDNFDGTNTDPLDARTTTGAGSADPLAWTDTYGAFEINTNQLRPIALDGIATLEDHGQANFILKYHINAQLQGVENNISVVARFKNAYRWIAVDHAFDSGGNSYLRVNQASASSLGVGELLAESGPGTFDFRQGNGGEWVTIIVLSNTLTAYVDSNPVYSTLTVDIDSELDAITVVGVFPPRLNPKMIRINDLQMTIFLGTQFTSDAAQIDIDGLSINSADGTFNTVWPPGFNSLPISIDIDGMSILSADGTFNANPSVALFTEGFESGNFLSPVGGTWNDRTLNISVSNLHPNTGAYSARFPYGGADSFAELRGTFTSSYYEELWFQFDLFIPSNYAAYNNPNAYGAATNSKLFAVWGHEDEYTASANNPELVLSLWTLDGSYSSSPGSLTDGYIKAKRFSTGHYNNDIGTQLLFIPRSDLTAYSANGGRWMTVTIHVASTLAANGTIEVWRRWEGESVATQILSYTNQSLYFAGQTGFKSWYLMGYSNPGYATSTTFYVDNVIVADTALDPDA